MTYWQQLVRRTTLNQVLQTRDICQMRIENDIVTLNKNLWRKGVIKERVNGRESNNFFCILYSNNLVPIISSKQSYFELHKVNYTNSNTIKPLLTLDV